MSWDTVNHYYSGQGVVLLAKRNPDGSPQAFYPVGNISDLKLSLAVSTLEHKESTTGQRATDLRLTTETKVSLSMTGENFISENLSRVTRGKVTTIASGSHTGVKVKGYKGGITGIGAIKVSAVTLKTDEATPKTLTAYPGSNGKWDYKLNAESGSFQLNADSATWDKLVAGSFTGDVAALTIDYTNAEQVDVDALTEGASELYMRFEGLNTAEENSPVVVEVFRFLVDPLKELALISDGVQQFVLEGSVLFDSTRAEGSKYFSVTKLN